MYKFHVLEQRLHVQEQLVADGTGARTGPTHEGRMLLQDAQVELQLLLVPDEWRCEEDERVTNRA